MQFRMRIARGRAGGSVDVLSELIEADSVAEAVEAAKRRSDVLLDGLPGVGILTDVLKGGLVWTRRWNMPSTTEYDLLRS